VRHRYLKQGVDTSGEMFWITSNVTAAKSSCVLLYKSSRRAVYSQDTAFTGFCLLGFGEFTYV